MISVLYVHVQGQSNIPRSDIQNNVHENVYFYQNGITKSRL